MCVGIPARVLRMESEAPDGGGDRNDGEPVDARAREHSGERVGGFGADIGGIGNGLRAQCATRHGPCTIDLALTGPLAPGTWVLSFLGAAREVIDAARARDIDAALDALEAIARGETRLDAYFPDLAGREPTLPAHLAHLVAPPVARVAVPVVPLSTPVIPAVSAELAIAALANPAHSPGKAPS